MSKSQHAIYEDRVDIFTWSSLFALDGRYHQCWMSLPFPSFFYSIFHSSYHCRPSLLSTLHEQMASSYSSPRPNWHAAPNNAKTTDKPLKSCRNLQSESKVTDKQYPFFRTLVKLYSRVKYKPVRYGLKRWNKHSSFLATRGPKIPWKSRNRLLEWNSGIY